MTQFMHKREQFTLYSLHWLWNNTLHKNYSKMDQIFNTQRIALSNRITGLKTKTNKPKTIQPNKNTPKNWHPQKNKIQNQVWNQLHNHFPKIHSLDLCNTHKLLTWQICLALPHALHFPSKQMPWICYRCCKQIKSGRKDFDVLFLNYH